MGKPAAKLGDSVVGVDKHVILVPAPPGAPIPTPFPHPFNGKITSNVSSNVLTNGQGAATVFTKVTNTPPHVPMGPGPFGPPPPMNDGIVMKGSSTVLINNKPASTLSDDVSTCDSYVPVPANRNSKIVTGSTNVLIGSGGSSGGAGLSPGAAGAAFSGQLNKLGSNSLSKNKFNINQMAKSGILAKKLQGLNFSSFKVPGKCASLLSAGALLSVYKDEAAKSIKAVSSINSSIMQGYRKLGKHVFPKYNWMREHHLSAGEMHGYGSGLKNTFDAAKTFAKSGTLLKKTFTYKNGKITKISRGLKDFSGFSKHTSHLKKATLFKKQFSTKFLGSSSAKMTTKSFAKSAGKVGGVAVLFTAADYALSGKADKILSSDFVVDATIDAGIAVGSHAAGAAIGAAIGTLIPIPVVGTILGAAIGIGISIGVNALLDKFDVRNKLKAGAKKACQKIKSGSKALLNGAKKAAESLKKLKFW